MPAVQTGSNVSQRVVDTAVIPVAGIGTRMAPATAGMPKFMIPVMAGNQAVPNIDYTLQDCIRAGIKNLIIITSCGGDKVLQDYLGEIDDDLAARYHLLGKDADLQREIARRRQYAGMNITYIDQPADLYGTAVPLKLARQALGDAEYFISITGDDYIWHEDGTSELATMIANWRDSAADCGIMGKPVSREEAPKYGILQARADGFLAEIDEKPPIERVGDQPLANVSRYILNKDIWPYVDDLFAKARDADQPEYYVTDIMNSAAADGHNFYMHRTNGKWFDFGSPAGVRYASDTMTDALAARS